MFGCTLAYLTTLYTDYAKAPHFGAVAVFLAWMELTLLTGRQTSSPAMSISRNVCSLKVEILLLIYLASEVDFRQVSGFRHLRVHERPCDQDAGGLPPVLRHVPLGVHVRLPPPLAQQHLVQHSLHLLHEGTGRLSSL